MMELADMNSLGLFDLKSYPFKSDLPYVTMASNYVVIEICCRLIGKS